MLGPNGIIIVQGSPESKVWCNKKSLNLAQKNSGMGEKVGSHLLEDELAKSKPKIITRSHEETTKNPM